MYSQILNKCNVNYYLPLLFCSINNCAFLNKSRIADSVAPGLELIKSVDVILKSIHFNDAET